MARRSRTQPHTSGLYPASFHYSLESRGPYVTARRLPALMQAPRTFPLFNPPRSSLNLLEIEDRRTFYPERVRPAKALRSHRHRLTLSALSRQANARAKPRVSVMGAPRARQIFDPTAARISFKGARTVAICIRRRQRRAALFASKRGALGAPRRRPRWNEYSYISCKG